MRQVNISQKEDTVKEIDSYRGLQSKSGFVKDAILFYLGSLKTGGTLEYLNLIDIEKELVDYVSVEKYASFITLAYKFKLSKHTIIAVMEQIDNPKLHISIANEEVYYVPR